MNIAAKFKPENLEILLTDVKRRGMGSDQLVIRFTDDTIFDAWKKSLRDARTSRWPTKAKRDVRLNLFY